MKKKVLITGGVLSLATAAVMLSASSAVSAASRDCSNNAIAKCGVHSVAELKQKYTANQSGDLDKIYAHYGITRADITSATHVKEGRTYKDGRVVVDGKTVATNAASLGRIKKNGDYAVNISGKTYWEAKNQHAFRSGSLEVLVFTKADGTFKAAVIKDCGNAVKATAVVKPETPKKPVAPKAPEAPKKEAPKKPVAPKAPEAPKQEAPKQKPVEKPVTPTPQPVIKPAPVNEPAAVKPIVKEEKEEVKVEKCVLAGKENLPKDSPECVEAPAVVPEELPATGAASMLSGVMGLSSLTAAGYYYVRSRRMVR